MITVILLLSIHLGHCQISIIDTSTLFENIAIYIYIDKDILKNIDIDIDIDKDILENIDIDIDNGILEKISISRSIWIRTFWVKDPFVSAESRFFHAFTIKYRYQLSIHRHCLKYPHSC